ncbi:MAG TPA: FAD-binding oxidoreductase [Candidatus Binatia bacterium]|nr:FAD-binding oxidoreductase [Candidatus Binatia bacterium]
MSRRDPFAGTKTQSLWQATMPTLPDRRRRLLPDTADVVVVGGGYTGLACARRLALARSHVVVLEAETLGWGASTRNGGIAHPGYKWGLAELVRRYGPGTGRALFEESLDAYRFLVGLIRDEGIEADLRPNGYLELAWSRADRDAFAAEAAALAEVGVPARVVDGAELRSEIGTAAYEAGLVVEVGAVLHPGKWFAGLAGLADRAGADLHEGVRVRSIRRQADGRFVVETSRGALLAREVVVATNGYTDGVAPAVRRRVVPVGSYIVATEPLPADVATALVPGGRGVFDSRNFLSYWQVSADRRLVFGGRVSFWPTWVGRTARLLWRRIQEVYPELGDVRIEYAWGGKVALTLDRMPHVGRFGGVWHAVGYSGTGVVLSTYLGTRLADWLLGGSPPAIAGLRFPLVPAPYEGRAWFLPLVGEWFRWQDRRARRSGR